MISLKKKRSFDLSKNEEQYWVLGQYLNDQGIAYSTVIFYGTYEQACKKLEECVETNYSSWYSVPTTISFEEVVAIRNSGDVWNQIAIIQA